MGDKSITRLRGLPRNFCSLALMGACYVVVLVILAGCERSPTPRVEILKEFFTHIKAGESKRITFEYGGKLPVLFTVNAHEATVESRISSPTGKVLNQAYFDFRRGVPIYQIVDAIDSGARFQVEIDVRRATRNSFLDIGVFVLPVESSLDRKRVEAYRLYSDSIQYVNSYSQSVWRERMLKLQRASQLFKQAGLTREQLWSDFLATVLAYFPLNDMATSLPDSRTLFQRARSRNLNDLAVMAMQLHGQSLMYGGIEQDDQNSASNIYQSITVFNQAAKFARDKNQDFQHAWALNNIGVAHYYHAEFEQAISMHSAGLAAGEALADSYLDNVLTSNIAAALQGQGKFEDVIKLLMGIIDSQRASGQNMELAFSLDRLGNTYTKLFYFEEAIGAYSEAFEIAVNRDDSEMAGLLSVSLGRAYFELGYIDNALQYIDDSIRLLEPLKAAYGLNTAHATAAKIFRLQSGLEKMRLHREKQGNYLTSELATARYTFEQALDLLASEDTSSSVINAAFEKSKSQSLELRDESLVLLSQLHLCLLQSVDRPDCDINQMQQLTEKFTAAAKPSEKLEALKLLSDLLISRGGQTEARSVLLGLLDEIRFYRSNLPGVMGAWYWQSRSDVFQRLMNLQIALDIQTGDGTDSFVLLNRLHNIGSGTAQGKGDLASQDAQKKLRSLMAQMDDAATAEKRTEIERQLQFELLRLPAGSKGEQTIMSRANIVDLLSSIPGDAAILTYYFSDLGAYAWVVDSEEIRLVQMSGNDALAEEITDVMESFRVVSIASIEDRLDKLGKRLLGPLIPYLKENIYFMTGGPLNGFPLDVLRYGSSFVAEHHAVINLQSLESINSMFHDRFERDGAGKVFLSGNPLPSNQAFPALPGSLLEIQAIQRIFSNNDVKLVSGEHFTRSVIDSEAFQSAQIIHIASHGELNMKYPELSRIMLSAGQDARDDFLTPHDLTRVNIDAQLVVLSACETGGVNTFQFESNLGFVSELLADGNRDVIASVFPVSDQSTAEFMQSFYTELVRSGSTSQSLAQTKRKFVGAIPLEEWAAFQLHR